MLVAVAISTISLEFHASTDGKTMFFLMVTNEGGDN